MCVYIGATVVDKRFPEVKLGRVSSINSATQVAIVDTNKGISAIPLHLIQPVGKNGGTRE